MSIHIINGPNINMLGKRETNMYGAFSLEEIEKELHKKYDSLSFFQSNGEKEIVEYIQELPRESKIVINAASLTHTSIAVRDALLAIDAKFVEVHISNVYTREEFRHKSYLSDKAIGVIVGLGKNGYAYAIDFLING